MTNVDLYGLNKPTDLYRITLEVYQAYIEHPTERDFLFLIFAFTHLREWIAEKGHKEIKARSKRDVRLTQGEEFFGEIYELKEFKVVQELCNRGKHHKISNSRNKTSQSVGLRAGMSKIGDRPDQIYFLIDGVDSRDFFIKLIHKYNSWFSEHEYAPDKPRA